MLKQTDARGNVTAIETDLAERAIRTTDAQGNITSTAYSPCCDAPACITNALGGATCYSYDIRGRKIAEYGTAVQPSCFAYDESNHMIALTTFRVDEKTSPPILQVVPMEIPPPGSTTRPRDWNSRKPMPTAPVFPKPTTGSTVWKHSPRPEASLPVIPMPHSPGNLSQSLIVIVLQNGILPTTTLVKWFPFAISQEPEKSLMTSMGE